MAMTTLERQQKFRARQRAKFAKRLDMVIDISTYLQLEDLALHVNKSKKDYLTGLINREYSRKIGTNEDGFDDFQQKLIRERNAQAFTADMLHGNNTTLTDEMLPDNDWQENGLDERQIKKIWDNVFEFGDFNLHLLPQYWEGNYIEQLKTVWEHELKDPSQVSKFKGIQQLLDR